MPKSTERMLSMVHKFVTGILIPVIFYLLSQINEVKKDLAQFEVRVAKEASQYAMRDDIVRVESKIDELKNLIIQEIKNK